MNLLRVIFLLTIFFPFKIWPDQNLMIAVASNFNQTAEKLANKFTLETQIPIIISSASTSKLYAQIINGAPYDIFLAADIERPQKLEENKYAVSGSRATYAVGALTLLSFDSSFKDNDCIAAIKNGSYKKLAIANPEIAPYGFAAKEFLKNIGQWESIQNQIVLGENVSQTLLFAATRNVTFALVSRSQATMKLPFQPTCIWDIPTNLYSEIKQQAILLSQSENSKLAQLFLNFLSGPEANSIIVDSGYSVIK
jgi:molybdate transport system substrate-binding protein